MTHFLLNQNAEVAQCGTMPYNIFQNLMLWKVKSEKDFRTSTNQQMEKMIWKIYSTEQIPFSLSYVFKKGEEYQ